jgi:hypothetical protein
MEKHVRSQARGLYVVSRVLLISCAAMTGFYGWSFGLSLAEKILWAVALVFVDIAGAYLMSTSGTHSAVGERNQAKGALILGSLCFCVTLGGIIGFQGTTREARAQSSEQASKLAAGFLEWSKSITVDALSEQSKVKDKGASASKTMEAGIAAVGKAVGDQIKNLQSGDIPTVGDGQSATIARVTGLAEADVRSWMTIGLAALLLIIQYGCLYQWSFLRNRVEPLVAAHAASGVPVIAQESHDKFGKSPAKFAKDAARAEVIRLIVKGERFPQNKALAARWAVSPTTVCHWLQDFADEGHAIPFRGKGKRVLAPNLNGNGAHHPATMLTEVLKKKASA